jgi:hypothetical protein
MPAPLPLLIVAAAAAAWTPDDGRPAIGEVAAGLEFKDIRYLARSLDDFGPRRAYVLVAVNSTCPLARRYLPVLAGLDEAYRDRGVQFVALDVGADETIREMAALAVDSGASFPFVRDIEGRSARALGLERTPEVAVLDAERRLRYRGRVDDQFRLGGERPEPSSRPLVGAIEAVLGGREVATPETPVDGCRITTPRPIEAGANPPNFAEHVEPILQRRCQDCHRPGAEAPFSLLSYADAASQAEPIAEAVVDGRMPPWYGTDAPGTFANHLGLEPEERETLLRWVAAGAPKGDPERRPAPRAFEDRRWEIGEPDLIITALTSDRIPATGFVPYRYAVLPHVFTEDTWVQALEIQADNPGVLHHANLGYAKLGEPITDDNFLTGRVPGGGPMDLEDGQAVLIPRGSVLGLQIHYTTTGKPERARLSVGLRFPRVPVRKRLIAVQASNNGFAIPPGDPAYEVRAARTIDHDATGVGLFAHMHLRGRDIAFLAHRPDGSTERLLLVPNYNFDWQQSYRWPPGAVHFPAGTTLEAVAHFDNSAFNPFNPDPSRTVPFGQQTVDEMMYGFFFILRDDEDLGLVVDPRTGHARPGGGGGGGDRP